MEPYYADGYPWNSLFDFTEDWGEIQAEDPPISLPDKMELIRQKVAQGLNRTHERAQKAYNTRIKLLEFSVEQVYRKNHRQSNKADGYNISLGPNRIRCVVLQLRAKRYMSWTMQWGKVSGYSMLRTCMPPEPLNVIRLLQKASSAGYSSIPLSKPIFRKKRL